MSKKAIWTPNFILLWLGYLVSSMGDHLNVIAFSVLVLEKTSSAFMVGVVLTTHFIPLIFGSIIAGPFVDRFSAKRIMILADMFRGGGDERLCSGLVCAGEPVDSSKGCE